MQFSDSHAYAHSSCKPPPFFLGTSVTKTYPVEIYARHQRKYLVIEKIEPLFG